MPVKGKLLFHTNKVLRTNGINEREKVSAAPFDNMLVTLFTSMTEATAKMAKMGIKLMAWKYRCHSITEEHGN